MAHAHDGPRLRPPRAVRVALAVGVGLVVAATVAGLLLLRPGPAPEGLVGALGLGGETVDGEVVQLRTAEDCPEPEPPADVAPEDLAAAAAPDCPSARVRLLDGPDAGDVVALGPGSGVGTYADLSVGDGLVLVDDELGGLRVADRVRDTPLLLLAGALVLAVVALGRLRGLAALAGLAVSALVVVGYLVPALLSGRPPLAVALVGGCAVLVPVLYLAHGISWRSSAALLGVVSALVLTAVLGAVAVPAARLSGLVEEEAVVVAAAAPDVDLSGLLLAGLVVGALGVLDDVAVTQVSAVAEVAAADRRLGVAPLVAAGLRVGRDHLAATINTLLLAYAGASLPVLVLFTASDLALADVLANEVVATEVVRVVVGSLGLVACVPLSTLLGALVVARARPEDDVPAGEPPGPAGPPGRTQAEQDRAWVDYLRGG